MAAVALILTVRHRAHSQISQDGPPVPVSGQRIAILSNGVTWQVPACFNLPIDRPNAAISRAVIGIHGIDRLSSAAYGALFDAARAERAECESRAGGTPVGAYRADKPAEDARFTLIVAPQFLTEAEHNRYHTPKDIPYWRGTRWIQGDESASSETRGISSFRLLDLLIARLTDGKTFPNLRTIVLAGHSGGGQFVQRYAAGTALPDSLASRQIDLRFVVANPSSYLYLTDERPVPSDSTQFSKPSPTIRKKVWFFNNYKYGLDRLNPYMNALGANQIRAQYGTRQITYLLGERDCDPRHPQLDRGRAAMMEGPNRLDRGLSYFRYLQHLYGPSITSTQKVEVVRGTGHSARRMFASQEGKTALFEESRFPNTTSLPMIRLSLSRR